MEKYSVCVNVEMNNWFEVCANSEAEAAEKAKQAMNDILEYSITYATENDDVEFEFGNNAITVGEAEYIEEDKADNTFS